MLPRQCPRCRWVGHRGPGLSTLGHQRRASGLSLGGRGGGVDAAGWKAGWKVVESNNKMYRDFIIFNGIMYIHIYIYIVLRIENGRIRGILSMVQWNYHYSLSLKMGGYDADLGVEQHQLNKHISEMLLSSYFLLRNSIVDSHKSMKV